MRASFDARRADAKTLQLGGGDFVANIERLGDQRRLLELLLLKARERAVADDIAVKAGGGNQRRVDAVAA